MARAPGLGGLSFGGTGGKVAEPLHSVMRPGTWVAVSA